MTIPSTGNISFYISQTAQDIILFIYISDSQKYIQTIMAHTKHYEGI